MTRPLHRFGLDHPTWNHPDAFFYDSEQQAREAVLKVYGPDSGHVIVEAVPV